MVPEFLREGSGVSDFFAPPFTVIGTDDALVGSDVAELFGGFDTRVHIVTTRTAEALKYACNAFHTTKVSFANEIGASVPRHGCRLPRRDGAVLPG